MNVVSKLQNKLYAKLLHFLNLTNIRRHNLKISLNGTIYAFVFRLNLLLLCRISS